MAAKLIMHHSPQRQKIGIGTKHEQFLYMRATPALSWRLDPDDSLSDWTLRVTSSENPTMGQRYMHQNKDSFTSLSRSPLKSALKTYFVHKIVLGVGPRKSEFFTRLFKKNLEDSRDDASSCSVSKNVTKIDLLPSAAARFPAMLDYVYAAPGAPLDINTNDAVAMRHLASSFGIKDLFNETTDFINADLNPETAPLYLMEARKFKNDKVANSAIQTIAKKFQTVKMIALSQIPPHYLLEIVQSENLDRKNSDLFSSKIAAYCRCRQEEITLPLLKGLMNAENAPIIAEDESLYFLHLLISLGGEEDNDEKNLFSRCMSQAPTYLTKARDAAQNQSEISKAAYRQGRTSMEFYTNLPDRIKVHILEKATAICQEIDDGNKEIKPTIARGGMRAKKQVLRMKADMENMRSTYEKKVEYLQTRLQKKEEELLSASSSNVHA